MVGCGLVHLSGRGEGVWVWRMPLGLTGDEVAVPKEIKKCCSCEEVRGIRIL